MFTALQLLGILMVVAALTVLVGWPGALLGVGLAAVYVGIAGELAGKF
jgi:hypothetical protein